MLHVAEKPIVAVQLHGVTAYADSSDALARRRRTVRVAKFLLPVAALVLLSSVALWPEISRTIERSRNAFHNLAAISVGGVMKQPRYRGYDSQNQPYMVSADTAEKVGESRYDLVNPRGDITLHNGTWLQVQSKRGVYVQKADQLDLTRDVVLYRQDGTTLTSNTATVDMKRGAVSSSDYTHAEGPFGTLDAEGFTLLDKGGLVQFHGPAKLVMNAAH
jgi:lipopolysaccharide export system protein LptC